MLRSLGRFAPRGMTGGGRQRFSGGAEIPRSLRSPRDDRRGTATAGGHGNARPTMAGASPCPTERQRPGGHSLSAKCPPYILGQRRPTGIGVPALQNEERPTADRLGTCPTKNGHGRRGSVSPPYRTRNGRRPAGVGTPALQWQEASSCPTERQRPGGHSLSAKYPPYIRGVPLLREGVCWGMDPSASVGMTRWVR